MFKLKTIKLCPVSVTNYVFEIIVIVIFCPVSNSKSLKTKIVKSFKMFYYNIVRFIEQKR